MPSQCYSASSFCDLVSGLTVFETHFSTGCVNRDGVLTVMNDMTSPSKFAAVNSWLIGLCGLEVLKVLLGVAYYYY